MPLPIGYDNFRELIENELEFVDKSLFIKEITDDIATKAAVITRPRRFGKTLNLSMLHHFLSAEVNGKATKNLFNSLRISAYKDICAKHQEQYPVIFVTFKDVKEANYEEAYTKLCKLMRDVYGEHEFLLSSPRLSDSQKRAFELILERKGSTADVTEALKDLTTYLSRHYGVNPWLLIDEYDTPIQASYVHGYYDQMIHIMRGLFGSALKTNPYLYRAVITGILRVAKESLFSGINNLKVYSSLHPAYSTQFGFTEEEVSGLARKHSLENQLSAIKEWYNGYQIGDTVLYNPWSIVNCIQEKGKLIPYWVNTSDNYLIRTILLRSSTRFKEKFEYLLQEKPVEQLVDENTVFFDLKASESAAWSLLLMTGYLKVLSQRYTEQGLWCRLEIPNKEVRNLYRQIIEEWLSNGHGIEWYNQFLTHLLTGNIDLFEKELQEVMEQTVSSHDTGRHPEAFYHGLMIGLTASLYHNEYYEIQSNKESGYGRYDYLIFARDKNKPTLLLEFKKVSAKDKELEQLDIHLEQAAQEALDQIDQKHYLAEAKQRGSTNILKIGLAFCGKRFKIKYTQLK
ncbi:MAG: hypothetical protein K0R24_2068 [Gammaproteobacteria bacterium]|jgi:hypothetical protein|nr:hypothetical protein [Gammaproteobacteria bacterium]